MLGSLIEETYDEFDQLVRIVQEGRMVGTIKDENLRQSLLKELVPLYDLICAISAEPILVAIAEGNGKWQIAIAQSILLSQTVVRKDAKLECRCEGSLCPTRAELKHTVNVSSNDFPVPGRVPVHVVFDRVADDFGLKAVGQGADNVEWRALTLPLPLPESRDYFGWRALIKRTQSNGLRVVLRWLRL